MRTLKNTLSHIADELSRFENGGFSVYNRPHGSLYGARKLLYPSLFLLYFEMLACMSISLSLNTAFTLNTLYFTIIFIEFECIL